MSYNTNIPESISKLLQEIYSINPELKKDETKIITIIQSMKNSKPNVVIDETFKKNLKMKIMNEFSKNEKSVASTTNYMSYIKNAGIYAAGLATASLFIFSLGTSNQLAMNNVPKLVNTGVLASVNTVSNSSISFKTDIRKVDDKNGFGKITLSEAPTTSQEKPLAMTTSRTNTRESVGGGSDGMIAMDSVATSKMIAPYPDMSYPYINYTYTGTLPELTSSLSVYKKSNSKIGTSETTSILNTININGFDIKGLQNAGISNVSLYEDIDFGYIVNIDFINGNISMYQNWEKWNTNNTLPVTTKMTDNELLSIAKEFFDKYNIDVSSYGTGININQPMIMPMVMRDSDISVGTSTGSDTAIVKDEYIPEQYSLVFPKLVNGNIIYEEYGNAYGLNITIDARTKKVSSFYGYDKIILDEAVYTEKTDNDTIKNIIKFGGRYETKSFSGQELKEISLFNPKIEYVHMYSYENNVSSEFLVPAYIFEVKNEENIYTPQKVIVPLVKDFATFQKYEEYPMGVIEPMPVIMEGSNGTVEIKSTQDINTGSEINVIKN